MTGWMHELAAPYEAVGTTDHAIVLVHGFTGSAAHMRPLAQSLASDGHSVVVPTLAGHGTRVEDMVDATRAQWQDDLDRAVLRAEGLGKRVHLVGFSLGALLCMFAADETVASLTLINAPIRFVSKAIFLAPALSVVSKFQSWSPGGFEPAPDLREYKVDYDGYSTWSVKHLLEARAAAFTAAPWIDRPTLIIQSRKDESVIPDSAYDLRDMLVRTKAEIRWLENSTHVAVLGNELDSIYRSVSAHIHTA